MLGSIPARAGEPGGSRTGRRSSWVYPRASGGTQLFDGSLRDIHGLSPRERGNLCALGDFNVGERSIPARAGEPTGSGSRSGRTWVYPRASGGTIEGRLVLIYDRGLSPRERGNPPVNHPHESGTRSIPARAGEPHRRPDVRRYARVYPRASGGTITIVAKCCPSPGLSPRERGNRIPAQMSGDMFGSIPARAGEPG